MNAEAVCMHDGEPVATLSIIAKLEEQNKELRREVERLRELIIEMCAAKVTTKNGR
jgi:tyrosine-protein phosphatase YwqE